MFSARWIHGDFRQCYDRKGEKIPLCVVLELTGSE
jgi:hypothetical protein